MTIQKCHGCNKPISGSCGLHCYKTFADAAVIGQSMEHMVAAPQVVSPDNWHPANGGTETPFQTRTGRTILYCWQPSTGQHAYLDCGSDLILTNEEARLALDLG